MNISVRPCEALRSSSRLSTCACTLTSSAETGSSQMISFGIEHERPGDRDALALPARELVGLALGGTLGVDADLFEVLVDLGLPLGLGADLPDVERLHDDVADLAPRVQRRDRVLEDHLDVRAGLAHAVARQLGQLLRSEADRARRRSGELHDRPPGGGLAAARFADETERLAGQHVEADSPETALTFSPVRPTGNSTTRSSTRSSASPGGVEVGFAGAGHQ